jgi:hypothetical protein
MTDDQLAKELHELKRRRETPLPLIEMFDALLSLPRTERKTEAQAIRRDHGYGIETVGTQGRLTATGRWRGANALISPLVETTVPEWPQQLVCPRCDSRTLDMVVTGPSGDSAKHPSYLNLPADRSRPNRDIGRASSQRPLPDPTADLWTLRVLAKDRAVLDPNRTIQWIWYAQHRLPRSVGHEHPRHKKRWGVTCLTKSGEPPTASAKD